MKKKIASLGLAILLIGVATFGCYPKENIMELENRVAELETQKAELVATNAELDSAKAEFEDQRDDLKSQIAEKEDEIGDLKERITELEGELSQFSQIEDLEVQTAELESEKALLEAEVENLVRGIESLEEPAPPISSKRAIGERHIMEIHDVVKKFYPTTNNIIGHRGPTAVSYLPLASLETLQQFLARDRTNLGRSWEWEDNAADELAFRLKEHWIGEGFPPHSLGLLKGKRNLPRGEISHWRNIFVTLEDDEIVLYEVVPRYDKIIKVEEPNYDTYFIIILNIL